MAELSHFVSDFQCLGADCEDTCCKGWGMQLDDKTFSKYETEAPELKEAVTTGEAERIMRRDPDTDYCVKYDNGWCGIHAKYGTDFLGDACHFFPRITRKLEDQTIMTAALSCPEAARKALLREPQEYYVQGSLERLPFSLKEYGAEDISTEEAIAIHKAFISAVSAAADSQHALARISTAGRSLSLLGKPTWPAAAEFYLNNADSRIPQAEPDRRDPFNLLNALTGLLSAAKPSKRVRLAQTIDEMAEALDVTISEDNKTVTLSPNSLKRYEEILIHWHSHGEAAWDPILKRYLQAELSISLFPFAGLGETIPDRITILGVRYATTRLAIQSALYLNPSLKEDDVIRIVQSLARFLDHLADPSLSLAIYNELGWQREQRLLGVINYGMTVHEAAL
jgi:lysine-N-methylase